MEDKLVTALVAILSFAVYFAGVGVGYGVGYKNGQLDYQRGKIQYELTETGYKEVVEVKE